MPISGCNPSVRPSESKNAAKPAATPVQPCAGGNCCANQGIASTDNTKAYVKDFKALQKDWPTLTPAQREQKLEDITNAQLGKSGVPKVTVTPVPLAAGNGGHLSFSSWDLAINKQMLDANSLSDADAKSLADTVYHESRHAEQWYLMAQRRAMNGETAATIRDQMTIPGTVATAATKAPLKAGSASAQCADQMHDSVYGKNAAARNTTLTSLMTQLGALNTANADLARVDADPKSTAKQKADAAAAATKVRADFDKVYKDYRALPEEADAFETGDKVGKQW